MLKGEKVTLRPVEREDLKRIQELSQDVELSILAGSEYQPRSLAHWEKHFEKQLEVINVHHSLLICQLWHF